jgi:excisionase family DNA binding protein
MASAEDVASAWGISTRTVYRLVTEQDLPAEQIGGALRFDPRALEQWRRRQIRARLREVED